MHGQRCISADTALRLARYFGTSERFWINLQARYDLEIEKDRLGGSLDEIRPLSAVILAPLPGPAPEQRKPDESGRGESDPYGQLGRSVPQYPG